MRAKRNLRYRKNRQKRIAKAKKSTKETTQESGTNKKLEPKQQERETPQQMDISRNEPHMGRDGPHVVE